MNSQSLVSFIDSLEQERIQKQETIRGLESEIDGIYSQEDDAKKIRDLNTRRAKVIGRISLWLESVENDTESGKQEQEIQKIEARLKEIDSVLNRDALKNVSSQPFHEYKLT